MTLIRNTNPMSVTLDLTGSCQATITPAEDSVATKCQDAVSRPESPRTGRDDANNPLIKPAEENSEDPKTPPKHTYEQFWEETDEAWVLYSKRKRNALIGGRMVGSSEYRVALAKIGAEYRETMSTLIDKYAGVKGFNRNFEVKVLDAAFYHREASRPRGDPWILGIRDALVLCFVVLLIVDHAILAFMWAMGVI